MTDEEYNLIKHLIPEAKYGGKPRTTEPREILNAIFYCLKISCQWRCLPHDFPNWKTVYYQFTRWKKQNIFEHINHELAALIRNNMGKAKPTVGIIDSQSVKKIEIRGVGGYDLVKKINGRKRHILVDNNGFILKCYTGPANENDRSGAVKVLPTPGVSVKKVYADMGYTGYKLHDYILDNCQIELEVIKRSRKYYYALPDSPPRYMAWV